MPQNKLAAPNLRSLVAHITSIDAPAHHSLARHQDTFNSAVSGLLFNSMVMGGNVLTFTPYTQAKPVVMPSSPTAASIFPFSAGQWQSPIPPIQVLIRAVDVTNPASPTTAPISLPSWAVTGAAGATQSLTITNLSGLLPGKSYAITVTAF